MALFAELLAVATLKPVGPGVDMTSEALSEVDALFEMSKASTMPVGGVIEVLELSPNRPTTSMSLTVVVTDGAAIWRVLAL
jgi:hypothetical protein